MRARDDQLGNVATGAQSADLALKAVTKELKNLQQTLIFQLAQDIARLQAEKSRLTDDVERLRSQQQQLQSQQIEALSQRQVAQQQLWAKRLAQALAAHLQEVIVQQFEQLDQAYPNRAIGGVSTDPSLPPAELPANYTENAYRLLASLDNTFTTTFKSLQQELATYQSSLSQQLNRMHSMEQQGEAILEALLNRLREQIDTEFLRRQTEEQQLRELQDQLEAQQRSLQQGMSFSPPNNGSGISANLSAQSTPQSLQPQNLQYSNQGLQPPTFSPQERETGSQTVTKPVPPPKYPTDSSNQWGFLLVMISTMFLSLHNVIVGIIGFGSKFFGIEGWSLGPFIDLVLGNSLLILLLRMLIVVPLLCIAAPWLYPRVWKDLERFLKSKDLNGLLVVMGSGAALFTSQVLIYIAIPKIGPGVAVTILFMYPIVTVPLAWWLLHDRPNLLRFGVMFGVACGVVLTAVPKLKLTGNDPILGVSTAVVSGIAFAFYLILMQMSFKKLNPVPASLVQFTTILVLAAFSLWMPLPEPLKLKVTQGNWGGVFWGAVFLGGLTLLGYLCNNLGIRYLGASRASILSSLGPAVTAILAFIVTPGPMNSLKTIQWVGIVIVTTAVLLLSQEKMLMAKLKGSS